MNNYIEENYFLYLYTLNKYDRHIRKHPEDRNPLFDIALWKMNMSIKGFLWTIVLLIFFLFLKGVFSPRDLLYIFVPVGILIYIGLLIMSFLFWLFELPIIPKVFIIAGILTCISLIQDSFDLPNGTQTPFYKAAHSPSMRNVQ